MRESKLDRETRPDKQELIESRSAKPTSVLQPGAQQTPGLGTEMSAPPP
jgi:hypothetical protein